VLGRDDFIYGQFGENFTAEGLPDDLSVRLAPAMPGALTASHGSIRPIDCLKERAVTATVSDPPILGLV
jgi:hypothetical protein